MLFGDIYGYWRHLASRADGIVFWVVTFGRGKPLKSRGEAGPVGQTWTFAVNSIPSAFMTAIVVFSVGLPFSLNDR